MAEIVEFNGVRFYRYPDSTRRADRVYFNPGPGSRIAGVKRLHEEIWMDVHGPIPDGSHIHHKDENPLNNAIDNLECLTPKAHMAAHWTEERSQQQREHANRIRPLAKAWHSTPEGRAWHRQHAYESIRAVEPTDYTCEQCAKAFTALPKKTNRFCSNACKSAWRRNSGLDDVQRECVLCGTEFTINRYAKTVTCSRSCAGKMQSATKTSLPSAEPPIAA